MAGSRHLRFRLPAGLLTFGYREGVPKTEPWHVAGEPDYHSNTECLHARAERLLRAQEGDGGKFLCKVCAALNRAEAQAEGPGRGRGGESEGRL